MLPRKRIEPCEVLRRDGVPSLLWLEDAIANYNVPTSGFDVFILVSNPSDAASTLRRAGWTDIEAADARSCSFLVESPTLSHRCLKPPGVAEPFEITKGSLPPLPSPRPTTTVLLSSQDFNVSIESEGPLLVGNFVPPLPLLVDGLISGVLDAPSESDMEGRLSIQLVYLYAHCKDITCPKLRDLLRFENRQFHTDSLTGPSVGKSRLMAWNRRVRRELLEGTRQLMDENSLLFANPSEYRVFISHVRSEFRPPSNTS